MDEKKIEANQPSIWRHPAVVSALIVGVFGIITVIINPGFWLDFRSLFFGPQHPVNTAPKRRPYIENGSASTQITQIMRALEHRLGSQPDIDTRREAIAALLLMADEKPSTALLNKAADILITYVRKNIDERRAPGKDVKVYKPDKPDTLPVFRPKDIIDALEALREIRRASGDTITIRIGAVDFHQINLRNLNLEGFYFGHANFSNGILSDCHCRGADFRHAKFHGTATWGTKVNEKPADFREVNFLEADLSGSKWANVDFTGSNIQSAVGHGQVGLMKDHHGLTTSQLALFPMAR